MASRDEEGDDEDGELRRDDGGDDAELGTGKGVTPSQCFKKEPGARWVPNLVAVQRVRSAARLRGLLCAEQRQLRHWICIF